MWRKLAWFRSLSIIVGVTLLLDFSITTIVSRAFLDELIPLGFQDEENYRLDVPWHHELRANLRTQRRWGPFEYPFATDEHGFRTGECAGSDPTKERDNTVFVVGDSFAEGLGVPFEESFAGLLACAYRTQGMVVRNLGTLSYSPVIYYRKIAESARRLGLTPREVVVFLDISDIHNDARDYREVGDSVVSDTTPLGRRLADFLKRHFSTFALLSRLRLLMRADEVVLPVSTLADWTTERDKLDSWGRAGLAANERNLGKIVDQCQAWKCRMTLVVYPWPKQILRGDLDSLQVTHWRAWSAARGIDFIDAFPPFFVLPADVALERYFLSGDVHLNARGNRLVFDTVWPELVRRDSRGGR